MANLDQIADFMADKITNPLEYNSQITYTELNAGWTAPQNGIMIVNIVPSNTSSANGVISNTTIGQTVCYISTTGGASQTCSIAVVKGHTYKIISASSNIQANNRFYGWFYTLF